MVEEPTQEVIIGAWDNQVVHLDKIIPNALQERMETCLQTHSDVFSWKMQDIPEIKPNIFSHQLNINPRYPLVQQKQQRFTPFKNQIIHKKLKMLLVVEFICEDWYPTWLANMVIAPKKNGKWRTCVLYWPH